MIYAPGGNRKRETGIADRFLAAEKQLEDERRTNGVHGRNDDVGKLGVLGNLELVEICRPAPPTDLQTSKQ